MIPPVRHIPTDYAPESQPREVAGDWPDFADRQRLPTAGFWVTFLGGVLITVTAIALSLWVLS